MNVEIGAEAALFPEKESVNFIFVAVYGSGCGSFYHQAKKVKKNSDSYTFLWLLYFKSNKLKIVKKIIFSAILKVTDENR